MDALCDDLALRLELLEFSAEALHALPRQRDTLFDHLSPCFQQKEAQAPVRLSPPTVYRETGDTVASGCPLPVGTDNRENAERQVV
ncbi:MAG: hypothetical protein Kow0010_23250 [Dehalococcoidia bacterium]